MASEQRPWLIEKLHPRHDRSTFHCGVGELDEYLQRYAGQNQRRGLSQHFVAVPASDNTRVLGYYAVSAGSVEFEEVPPDLTRGKPRYPIPVVHLGRLAVDQSVQGRGLGEDILFDALSRACTVSEQIGVQAVEVAAIDDRAKRFYQKYGFVELADDPRHLYLKLSTARQVVVRRGPDTRQPT